jgi:putative Ig domain-containing protein
MPGKKTFTVRRALLKNRITLLFIVLAVSLAFSWLQHSSAARQSSAADNQPPVLSVPDKQDGKANTNINFTVVATDPDSLGRVSITADDLPAGASFEIVAMTGNSRVGEFSWVPTAADAGRSYIVTFTASDGELSDTGQVTIHVAEAPSL